MDQSAVVLRAPGEAAKKMDDDGVGEKIKHFLGGGEDDSKIATEGYWAMANGLGDCQVRRRRDLPGAREPQRG